MAAGAFASVDQYRRALGQPPLDESGDDPNIIDLERDLLATSDVIRLDTGRDWNDESGESGGDGPPPPAIVRLTIDLCALWRLESPRATTRMAEGLAGWIGTSAKAQGMIDRVLGFYRKDLIV